MTRTVAITGGLGFLGGRIADHLRAAGDAVRPLTRDGARRPDWTVGMDVRTIDLMSAESLAAAFEGADAVVHLAAMNAGACRDDPAGARRVNVEGTIIVTEAMRQAGARRLIYMSTVHVYAAPLSGTLDETSPTTNQYPYALTHLMAEQVVREADHIDATVLRLSNAVGAPMDVGADCWMLVANDLARQVAETGAIELESDGAERRDFIAIGEVAQALRHFLDADPAALADDLFNLVSGAAITLADLARLIQHRAEAVIGIDVPVRFGARAGGGAALQLSSARAQRAGLTVDPDLTGEIDRLLLFCRDNF